MSNRLPRRSAVCVLAGLAMVLAGCNDEAAGDSPVESTPPSVSVAPSAPATPSAPASPSVPGTSSAAPVSATVPEYKALRASTGPLVGGAAPDAAALAAMAADNRDWAVAQLLPDVGDVNYNPAVIPALTYAVLRSLGAAADGDSLAQINSHFDLATPPYLAARQTGRVAAQWWAERGQRLRTEFLSATDALGPWPRLAAWSAEEAGFADGSARSDATLAQALSAASSGLSVGAFGDTTHIRLLAAHSLSANTGWSAVIPFEGIFERSPEDLLRLPLLRLTAGVTRHSGADFTADLLHAGDLRLMTLRPAAGSLQAFAAGRLGPALAEAIDALLADGAAPAAGEMLLPLGNIGLTLHADAPLRRAGVSQVFDEVNANLRGLDGVGGTYAQAVSPTATLRIADGLTLQAAHALAFTFSPRNVNGPSYGSVGFSTFFPDMSFNFGTCVWPTPDLRSFFAVILDAQRWVVSVAAIQSLPGTPVTPICSF